MSEDEGFVVGTMILIKFSGASIINGKVPARLPKEYRFLIPIVCSQLSQAREHRVRSHVPFS